MIDPDKLAMKMRIFFTEVVRGPLSVCDKNFFALKHVNADMRSVKEYTIILYHIVMMVYMNINLYACVPTFVFVRQMVC